MTAAEVEWDNPDDPTVWADIEDQVVGGHDRCFEEPGWMHAERVDALDARLRTMAEEDKTDRTGKRRQSGQVPARDEAWRSSFRPGGSWVLDAPTEVPALWGAGDEVLWAQGEALMIVGPSGVGKTTLAHQILLARLGVVDAPLGLPVRASERVLVLAMDRPAQARRAMARLVRQEHRELLDDGLVWWEGPPPYDLARNTDVLAEMALEVGADTVLVDSLKDAAIGLSEDEVGAGYNRARQTALTAGIDVLELHHQRKAQSGGGKPKALDDVFGSTWLTAGAGSVVLLWGTAGDELVELVHIKQPAAEVGPLKLAHDHNAGTTDVRRGQVDAFTVLMSRSHGVTAKELAKLMAETTEPTDVEERKARRHLERLVSKGRAHREDPERGGVGGTQPARYYPVAGGSE